MLQTRSRMVAFRVSEEEYQELQSISAARGNRSVSEFIRSGVIWIMSNCDRPLADLLFTAGQSLKQQLSPRSQHLRENYSDADRSHMPPNKTAQQALLVLDELSCKVELLLRVLRHEISAAPDSPPEAGGVLNSKEG